MYNKNNDCFTFIDLEEVHDQSEVSSFCATPLYAIEDKCNFDTDYVSFGLVMV